MKVTISNVPWCVNNTLYYLVFVALNHLNIRFTSAAPKLDTITPNWTYNLLVYCEFIVEEVFLKNFKVLIQWFL
jgi:hypothetical protein